MFFGIGGIDCPLAAAVARALSALNVKLPVWLGTTTYVTAEGTSAGSQPGVAIVIPDTVDASAAFAAGRGCAAAVPLIVPNWSSDGRLRISSNVTGTATN